LNLTELNDIYDKLIINAEKMRLDTGIPSEQTIQFAAQLKGLTQPQISECIKRYHQKTSVEQADSNMIAAEYTPWLNQERENITFYYWNRYKDQLIESGFPFNVVSTLDRSTNDILDHLENPKKDGKWTRRGMVVGHVQSGKTANFTGLICKATDAGYQVIIVLAGMLNSLRNQTQTRLDEDFIGYCAELEKGIGVGVKVIKDKDIRRPIALTTKSQDFRRTSKRASSFTLASVKESIVFILKKNKSTLNNLYKWLKNNNGKALRDCSLLMIDDESDHASINTNREDRNPTAINRAIRELLALFGRSSYVGYTATPFANIFIDPDSEHEMLNGEMFGDLFPKDFILNLNPPTNYFGPGKIFSSVDNESEQGSNQDDLFLRIIDDYEDSLPLKHKSSYIPQSLPQSLETAIQLFILSKAIRIQRGYAKSHHSMMINVSRFNIVQEQITLKVHDYIEQLRASIQCYSHLPFEEIEDQNIHRLHALWNIEYSTSSTWSDVLPLLVKAIGPAEVQLINSKSTDKLDYSKANYPNGRTVIAIGGLSLSRGLTLEGLCVSYFLRNSRMYDTLMQMGRWFGYRDYYEDLCRVYMTIDAANWYSHIHDSTEELRLEFDKMKKLGTTPKDFGLKVRSHPTSLIVTARNKMRAGENIPVSVSLANRLVQTTVIHAQAKHLSSNTTTLKNLIKRLVDEDFGYGDSANQDYNHYGRGPVWLNVPNSYIQDMLDGFLNHYHSFSSDPKLISKYIDLYDGKCCDILLRSRTNTHQDTKSFPIENTSIKVNPIVNTKARFVDQKIVFKNDNITSERDESIGLSQSQLQEIKTQVQKAKDKGKKRSKHSISYRSLCRAKRKNPLITIYFIHTELNTVSNSSSDSTKSSMIVPCFTMSFPQLEGIESEKTISYVVNTTYLNEEFNYECDDDHNED
jgi:hypothetical protein